MAEITADKPNLGYPEQRLTESEKKSKYGSVKEWGKKVIQSILGLSDNTPFTTNVGNLASQVNYDLYNGRLNMGDFDYICKPYGVQRKNFPAELRNYNIIKPKLDLLLGEEIKRPFNFKVVVTNPEVISSYQQQKQQMVLSVLDQMLITELANRGVPVEDEEGERITFEQVDKYVNTSLADMREILGNQALKYLTQYCNLQYKFNGGWKNFLIDGNEVYWTGIINGEPVARLVNPVNFYCEKSMDVKFIDEAQWAYEERYMTPSEVYDEFHEVLEEADRKKIDELSTNTFGTTISDTNIGIPISYQSEDGLGSSYHLVNGAPFIRIINVEWKSLRKIGFLKYTDETGNLQETVVDETFKMPQDMKAAGAEVHWDWINEVWQGVKIGSEIYVNIAPKPNQFKSLDNPSRCKLGYTGVKHSMGLVEAMKPHQYLYNILMYNLELAMAKAKGKVLLMDVSQIPRSMGIDTEKWLYYLDAIGIAFINAFEEGSGKFEGRNSPFNQFQALDLSMARIIDQYVMLLNKIEDMVGEISGVSRQRQGQVQTSELVGNVERAVVQSSHVTESMFYIHGEVKRRVLSNLLDASKIAWMTGKKAQYVLDDLSRSFFSIDGPEFSDAEFGVFVSNSSKDDKTLETLRQLAQVAIQSGQITLKDVAYIMESSSIADIKRKLDQSLAEAAQRQEQTEEAAREHETNLENMRIEDAESQRQHEMDIAQLKVDGQIEVAEISADSKKETQDTQEQNKTAVEREKHGAEMNLKYKQHADDMALKRKQLADKKELEQKKITAKNKQKPKK